MNIYVGNISRSTSEETVHKTFEQYGQVSSVKLIKDKATGQMRGFGFVDMPANDEALAAINALNGVELEGRKLIVSEAREREERPARDTRFSGPRRAPSTSGGYKPRTGGNRY
jgi:RNA recognition motif-containing protein